MEKSFRHQEDIRLLFSKDESSSNVENNLPIALASSTEEVSSVLKSPREPHTASAGGLQRAISTEEDEAEQRFVLRVLGVLKIQSLAQFEDIRPTLDLSDEWEFFEKLKQLKNIYTTSVEIIEFEKILTEKFQKLWRDCMGLMEKRKGIQALFQVSCGDKSLFLYLEAEHLMMEVPFVGSLLHVAIHMKQWDCVIAILEKIKNTIEFNKSIFFEKSCQILGRLSSHKKTALQTFAEYFWAPRKESFQASFLEVEEKFLKILQFYEDFKVFGYIEKETLARSHFSGIKKTLEFSEQCFLFSYKGKSFFEEKMVREIFYKEVEKFISPLKGKKISEIVIGRGPHLKQESVLCVVPIAQEYQLAKNFLFCDEPFFGALPLSVAKDDLPFMQEVLNFSTQLKSPYSAYKANDFTEFLSSVFLDVRALLMIYIETFFYPVNMVHSCRKLFSLPSGIPQKLHSVTILHRDQKSSIPIRFIISGLSISNPANQVVSGGYKRVKTDAILGEVSLTKNEISFTRIVTAARLNIQDSPGLGKTKCANHMRCDEYVKHDSVWSGWDIADKSHDHKTRALLWQPWMGDSLHLFLIEKNNLVSMNYDFCEIVDIGIKIASEVKIQKNPVYDLKIENICAFFNKKNIEKICFIDFMTPTATYSNLSMLIWLINNKSYSNPSHNRLDFRGFLLSKENKENSILLNIFCVCMCVFILMFFLFEKKVLEKTQNLNIPEKEIMHNRIISFAASIKSIFHYKSWDLQKILDEGKKIRPIYESKKSTLLSHLNFFEKCLPEEFFILELYLQSVLFPTWEGFLVDNFDELVDLFKQFQEEIKEYYSFFPKK